MTHEFDRARMDERYDEAKRIVIETGNPSPTYLGRVMGIGYNRVSRLIEAMQADGVLSAYDPNGKLTVLQQSPARAGDNGASAAHAPRVARRPSATPRKLPMSEFASERWHLPMDRPAAFLSGWSVPVIVVTNRGNVARLAYFNGPDGGQWQDCASFQDGEIVAMWREMPSPAVIEAFAAMAVPDDEEDLADDADGDAGLPEGEAELMAFRWAERTGAIRPDEIEAMCQRLDELHADYHEQGLQEEAACVGATRTILRELAASANDEARQQAWRARNEETYGLTQSLATLSFRRGEVRRWSESTVLRYAEMMLRRLVCQAMGPAPRGLPSPSIVDAPPH